MVGEIAVRVKPGKGEAFVSDFENSAELQGRGGVWLGAPEKITYRRMASEQSDIVSARLYVSLICFIFIIIFLGLLGSFWFRVHQRTGEIAIRKVCGASRMAVFRRIIGEGMILLLIATCLTAAAGWTVMLQSGFSADDLRESFVIELLVFTIVAVCVVVSLWWPSRRAMKIEPALAIKDE